MPVHKVNLTALLSSVCLLSACGGGGGSSVASTPAPPPAPPSPPYDSFEKPTATVFKSVGAEVTFTQDLTTPGAVQAVSGKMPGAGTLTVDYRPDTGTYIVSDGNDTVAFEATDKFTPSPNSNLMQYGKERPSSIVGQTNYDTLNVYTNPGFASSYANIVTWWQSKFGTVTPDPNSGLVHLGRATYGIIGYQTAASDMPRTGFVSYFAYLTAMYARNGDRNLPTSDPAHGDLSIVGGSALFEAHFEAGTVKTTVLLNLGNRPTTQLTGTGAIGVGTSRFSGALTAADPATSGTFEGGFYGPKAVEMGYTFLIKDPNGVAVGAVIGGRR